MARREHRDELGDVHRRAATQPDHNLHAARPRTFRRFEDDVCRWVGDHIVDHAYLPAVLAQIVECRSDEAALVQKTVSHHTQTRMARIALSKQCAQAAGCAALDKDGRNSRELERKHG